MIGRGSGGSGSGNQRVRRSVYAAISVAGALTMMGGCDPCGYISNHRLQIDPSPAEVGTQVTFTARAKTYREADNETFLFDLDGDGVLEETVRPNPILRVSHTDWVATARKTYDVPATLLITSVMRTQPMGYEEKKEFLEVRARAPEANQPPLAAFTMNPNPVAPEGTVTYDASESMDPDGQIAKYEWDLDHDGSFERDTGTNPVTTRMDDGFPGEYTIGLRVTDDDGDPGTTTRQLIVQEPTPRLAPAAKIARRLGGGGKEFAFPPRLSPVEPGQLLINGDELIIQGRADRGHILANPFPASLRHGKRKVRWISTVDATVNLATSEAAGRGFALLRFPAGGRACLGFRLDAPRDGPAAGSLRVQGGVGRASGLRGKGAGEGRLTADGVAVSGTLQLGFGGKESFRLGKSGCAPLLRLAR